VPLTDHSTVDPERTHPDFSLFATPTGLTREDAIAQLRARRGRAKSVAVGSGLGGSLNLSSSTGASAGMTPATTGKRGGMFDASTGAGAGVGVGEEVQTPRREFSAPEMGTIGKSQAGMRSVSRSVARGRVVSK